MVDFHIQTSPFQTKKLTTSALKDTNPSFTFIHYVSPTYEKAIGQGQILSVPHTRKQQGGSSLCHIQENNRADPFHANRVKLKAI
jgi:hypothetical protein